MNDLDHINEKRKAGEFHQLSSQYKIVLVVAFTFL
tara:strand:- start:2295 stop:2399 length:105 start_codon:yes stop_codon:yes gene_type:complete